MAQVKIYGRRDRLQAVRSQLSDTIHGCLVSAFGLPPEKRFQRFFALDDGDFIYPEDRSERYTIIEIVMFEGRSAAAKKELIHSLFAALEKDLSIPPQDVEIVMIESPRANWGIRGKPGDELALNYKVDV
jgi:phenylpyruvate tautomerase PptA (4-oxalocrotonate tautomerase family)